MTYWQDGAALTILMVIVLLFGCELVARLVPALRRIGLPLAILAGTLGLILGDQVLGVLALDIHLLESIVYHGLAIVFISVGLQSPKPGRQSRGSISMGFAVVAIMASQAALGLGLILLLDSSSHPGFGLLLLMGFEEGPGQALAMGSAWEASGMPDGAQVGLIFAVIGYAWAIIVGVPLAMWGRHKGWTAADLGSSASEASTATFEVRPSDPGALDGLSIQVAVVGLCYLVTWALCSVVAGALAGMPDVAAVVWGVHFIVGAGVAMAVRPLLRPIPGGSPIDDHEMARVSGLTVDVITCAALAAVQLTVLRSHWLPILVITSAGGLWTLGMALWLARGTAWKEAPFEHAIVWFGMSTGTLPTGLALLKVIDPDLRSTAPLSAVFGSGLAFIGAIPLFLVVVPMTVTAYGGDAWPGRGWVMFGALASYALTVFALWWLAAKLLTRAEDRAQASRSG